MLLYRELTTEVDLHAYERFLDAHPHASLWQSGSWETYEKHCGRSARRFVGEDQQGKIHITALVSIDKTVMHLATWTVQRGPLWDSSVEPSHIQEFMDFLTVEAKKDRAMSLFCSPVTWEPLNNLPGKESKRHIVPQATIIVDLTQSEEAILKAMHPKGRYNMNIAKRDGVTAEESNDIDAFYSLLQATGGRDGFTIKRKSDYEAFVKMPGSFLLLALEPTQKKPIAGLVGVLWKDQALYYYGASDYASRALMAPYALQWAAIQRAKAAGCTSYDLLGISPPDAPKSDPWQGITDFKKKFGGMMIEYPAEREMVIRPLVRNIIGWKRKMLG